MTLEVLVQGTGPRVVLVHGGVAPAQLTWIMQMPLAERWTLVTPNRPGFGGSPGDGEDFLADAEALGPLIEDGDHLVGYSYGGIGLAMAASRHPDAVRSLTFIETPAFGVAADDEVVGTEVARFNEICATHAEDADALLRAFVGWVGPAGPLPEPAPPELLQGASLLANNRPPQDAQLPLAALRAAPFPKLVVRGDGNPALIRVCEVLADELDAETAHIGGFGHMIPFSGQALNDVLESFWTRVS